MSNGNLYSGPDKGPMGCDRTEEPGCCMKCCSVMCGCCALDVCLVANWDGTWCSKNEVEEEIEDSCEEKEEESRGSNAKEATTKAKHSDKGNDKKGRFPRVTAFNLIFILWVCWFTWYILENHVIKMRWFYSNQTRRSMDVWRRDARRLFAFTTELIEEEVLPASPANAPLARFIAWSTVWYNELLRSYLMKETFYWDKFREPPAGFLDSDDDDVSEVASVSSFVDSPPDFLGVVSSPASLSAHPWDHAEHVLENTTASTPSGGGGGAVGVALGGSATSAAAMASTVDYMLNRLEATGNLPSQSQCEEHYLAAGGGYPVPDFFAMFSGSPMAGSGPVSVGSLEFPALGEVAPMPPAMDMPPAVLVGDSVSSDSSSVYSDHDDPYGVGPGYPLSDTAGLNVDTMNEHAIFYEFQDRLGELQISLRIASSQVMSDVWFLTILGFCIPMIIFWTRCCYVCCFWKPVLAKSADPYKISGGLGQPILAVQGRAMVNYQQQPMQPQQYQQQPMQPQQYQQQQYQQQPLVQGESAYQQPSYQQVPQPVYQFNGVPQPA